MHLLMAVCIVCVCEHRKILTLVINLVSMLTEKGERASEREMARRTFELHSSLH